MNKTLRKIASFTFRWGIAIVGIWWVVTNMSLADHAIVLDQSRQPQKVIVEGQVAGGDYRISEGAGVREVSEHELINAPDRETVKLASGKTVFFRGMDLTSDRADAVEKLLVSETATGPANWISPAELSEPFHVRVPHPKVEVGLRRMTMQADPWLLILAVAIFPITIVVTSIRWRRLLAALDIHLALTKTLALNWVGLFYNTFIPMGSTGGDLLKAYYAAKHTPHKTRAVMSVLVDRIVGLLVLIILGGVISGTYYLMSTNKMDPAVRACRNVSLMALLIMCGIMTFLMVAFSPRLRGLTRFEKLLAKLPMQKHVQSAIEVMAIYRQEPRLVLWSMLVTVPVHVTVVISAMLAGQAFGLPLSPGYYFIVVPVTVLVGAIPISPQGAGVMEFFAINLTARQGATVSQAFALTMSIRLVQIFWNLVGGIFVAAGNYREPRQNVAEPEATQRDLGSTGLKSVL